MRLVGSMRESVSMGVWWAAVTMTTVGCGDATPKTAPGRALALVWMFVGVVALAILTATVTSVLTVAHLRGAVEQASDLTYRGRMSIAYEAAAVPVRQDLVAAQRRAWERLARAGTWWSGAQRVAIAAEVRRAAGCALCAARTASLSPYTVAGAHAATPLLSAAAVDVAHRVTTDPGRITRAWFDTIAASGLSDGEYVELLGVVVTVVSIDSFCRGLGVAPHPLPEPQAGTPTRTRPAALRDDGAWVPMLPNGRREGPEADLWGAEPGGRTGNVIRALSLVPDEVRTLKDLGAAHYMTTREMMDLRAPRRALDRRQVELIAGRVSALRGCFY